VPNDGVRDAARNLLATVRRYDLSVWGLRLCIEFGDPVTEDLKMRGEMRNK
jgi:hypothetical protein